MGSSPAVFEGQQTVFSLLVFVFTASSYPWEHLQQVVNVILLSGERAVPAWVEGYLLKCPYPTSMYCTQPRLMFLILFSIQLEAGNLNQMQKPEEAVYTANYGATVQPQQLTLNTKSKNPKRHQ